MSRKQLFMCDLLQRREIGLLHRNEQHQLTEASTGLADKLLVHNNVIKVNDSESAISAYIWCDWEIFKQKVGSKTLQTYNKCLCFVMSRNVLVCEPSTNK